MILSWPAALIVIGVQVSAVLAYATVRAAGKGK